MGNLDKRFPHYSKLLGLYPEPYRKEYKEQMLQTLADMLDDPDRSRRGVWTRTIVDFPLSLIGQQLHYLGGAMANQMPNYIKRNSLLGAWLVAPFFVFLVVNAVFQDRVQNTFLWHNNILFMWLIFLPALAVLFNLISLIRWLNDRHHTSKKSLWRTLFDFKNNWPALAVILVGLGILALVIGHDSVHCVTGNPVRELHNANQTWQCISQNAFGGQN